MQPQRREVCVKYEREQQRLAKQIKRMVILIKRQYLRIQKRTRILELRQCNAYALPSHTFPASFVAQARPTSPKARATPTNPHVLVQRPWKCARGIHCKHVHLVPNFTD